MHPKPHRGTWLLTCVAVAALVSGACVKADAPGVSISEVKTSAKFGFEEKEKQLSGFDVPEEAQLTAATPLPELPLGAFTNKTAVKKVVGNPDCPEATNDVFPKDPATVQVKGMPVAGTYKWKRDAVIVVNRAAKPPFAILPERQVETRYIRAVVRDNDHQFKFQMVAPEPFTTQFVYTSFLVNNNPVLHANERVDAKTVGVVDTPGADVRVTPPNDAPGVYITKVETKDSKGATLFAFSPVRPMLVLPLEEGIIRTGQAFNSVGIDPTTGDILINEGTVGKTSEIDACGELVQGYSVSLDQTYTRDVNTGDAANEVQRYQARQLTRNLVLSFASQYGMLPVGDALTIGQLSDARAYVARRSIGGTQTTPLPPSLK